MNIRDEISTFADKYPVLEIQPWQQRVMDAVLREGALNMRRPMSRYRPDAEAEALIAALREHQ